MTGLSLPANLAAASIDDPSRADWLADLPKIVTTAVASWDLVELGAPFEPGGMAAWVAPARTADGAEVVLKVGFPHYEARDEAAGLREWDGAGTARLLAEDPAPGGGSRALLLERCRPGASLADRPAEEQDAVIAALLPRLWTEPASDGRFRPLAQMCDDWTAGFRTRHPDDRIDDVDLDPGLIRAGLALFTELPRSAARQVLLATDLHAENVISAEREPWLVIDPKPYVGDPTYDVLQHMLNCPHRLLADPVGLVASLAAATQLEPDRLTHWLFARCVLGLERWPGLATVLPRLAPASSV